MFTDEFDGTVNGSKLELGYENKKFFEEYVLQMNDGKTREEVVLAFKKKKEFEVNKKIEDAYNYINRRLFGEVEGKSPEEVVKIVEKIQEKIYKKLSFVKIVVENDTAAFMLFETLNDRGLDLASTDLIKNRLLKNISKESSFDEYKEKWSSIVKELEKPEEFKKYVRHYLISKNGYFNERKMFDQVKKIVGESSSKARELIDKLSEEVNDYIFILNPEENNNIHKDARFIELLVDIKLMKFEVVKPAIMSLIRVKKEVKEINRIVEFSLNFLIRYVSIGKKRPSRIEKIFFEYAKDLNFEKFSKELYELSPDEEFRKNLNNLTVNYKNTIAYYLLTKYEESKHKNEKWNSPGRKHITVEHILPQTIKNDEKGEKWIKEFGSIDECKKYTNSIGNLALLGQKGQNKASNKGFDEKKEVYKKNTDMFSTKEIGQYLVWNKKTLIERQEKMIEVYMEIFKL